MPYAFSGEQIKAAQASLTVIHSLEEALTGVQRTGDVNLPLRTQAFYDRIHRYVFRLIDEGDEQIGPVALAEMTDYAVGDPYGSLVVHLAGFTSEHYGEEQDIIQSHTLARIDEALPVLGGLAVIIGNNVGGQAILDANEAIELNSIVRQVAGLDSPLA